MITEKTTRENLLNATLDKAVNIGFGIESIDSIEDVFAEKLMVIGTAVEEKYTSLDGLRKLIRLQKEQSQGMELDFTRTEVYRDLPAEGNIAIIVEDIRMNIKINDGEVGFDMRASAILEFINERWKLIHWHVSKPEQVQSEEDTYGVEEWRQKTNALEKLVAERTADLTAKNGELNEAIANLKSTQKQLIQSEKMASLGELTAGIAHEIQNPLNFVNNFSEISRDLIDELKNQKSKLKIEDQEQLLSDIDHNLEKINQHGKKADAIVKGMLQHSRSSDGKKEMTDINSLCDEYVRLSYHGLSAKDNSFNATIKTDFDSVAGSINIIPRDMGRVILNLLTNAFYACTERSRSMNEKKKQKPEGYDPTVTISTKKSEGKVEIQVADNGGGIPQKVLDKIFQPFFTTKPTGQGTGLGLSLSYDIVKAHGGEFSVESLSSEAAAQTGKNKEGAVFTILLPANIQNI